MPDVPDAGIEELAKDLCMAWVSAEDVVNPNPQEKHAAWFATENRELFWRDYSTQRDFFRAMARALGPRLRPREPAP